MSDRLEILIPAIIIGIIIGLILRAFRLNKIKNNRLTGNRRDDALELIKKMKSKGFGFHKIINSLSEKGVMKAVAEELIIEIDNKINVKQ
ncbi:MAG: hypothetical protein IPO16_05990 [Saprospiraceae bacterium]|nr:hypothetical protein [Saprospiraceae bacterium]MBK9221657.1 hypothetical protein [Saprospiraceae bacterium]